MTNNPNINNWVFAMLIVELFVLTLGHEWFNSWPLPAIFIGAGLVIIGLSLKDNKVSINPSIPSITLWSFLIFLIGYLCHRAPLIFDFIPIDYRIADMLPVMEIMARRWIEGEVIYDVIPEIWEGIEPVYLPSIWLPIIPVHLLHLDVRWIGVIGMILMIPGLVFLRTNSPRLSSIFLVFIPLALFVIWHARFQLNTIALSNEGIVFFYYAVLCLAISRKWYGLIGLTLGLCLLSRYYIGPWAIMILIAYFIDISRSYFLKMITIFAASIILLMSIGHAWSEIPRFMDLPNHYLSALLQDPGKYQPLIDESLSLMRYFKFEHIDYVHFTTGILMWIVPGLALWYWLRNRGKLDFQLFALLSMKLSVLVFFALLTMPYHYLFSISFVISLAIASYVSNSSAKATVPLEKNDR